MNKKLIFGEIIAVVIILFMITCSPFEVVKSEQKGLKFTFGEISNEILEPGLKFKWPIVQDIKKINMRAEKIDFDIEVGTNGAITKDNQTIGSTLEAFYRYKASGLVTMWTEYGEQKIRELVKSTTTESFKAIVGTYVIFDLPINREEIRNKVFTQIKEKLANYPVELVELKIVNYDWSDDFDKQIKVTMDKAQQVRQKEQDVKQKEQDLLMDKIEQQKKVIAAQSKRDADIAAAEGEKQSMILKAQGEYEASVLRKDAKIQDGLGIKKYNEYIASTLQIELQLRELEIRKIEKERWNGQYVPENHYGPIPVQTNSYLKPQN